MEYTLELLKERTVERNGCWEWQRARNKLGYGNVGHAGKTWLSHRLAYMLHHKIDLGDLIVCHRCDNPPCINPDHLFLGTKKDNARDMADKGRISQQKRTHCPQGHEYDEKNTYISGKGDRHCRECRRDYMRKKADAENPNRVRKRSKYSSEQS